jgi:exonuclease III
MLFKIYKLLNIIIIAIVCTGCYMKKSKSISLMTWNIWHGGLHGNKLSGFAQDTSNTVNVYKVIKQENPDILFMQETYCCGMDIAKQAGYTYTWRGSSNLSIHSKYPIIDTIHLYIPFNSHGVVIDIEGKKVLFLNIWLHYLPDSFQDIKTLSSDSLIMGEKETRLKEITAILSSVDSLKNKLQIPIIMGGDFNSGSHLDWVESTKESHYNKVVPWPVSKSIVDSGFKDSFREINPDPSTTLEGTWGFLSEDIISDRIDFIYYKGKGIKAKDSKIVMDDPEGGFFNSDHRAILTKFDIKR